MKKKIVCSILVSIALGASLWAGPIDKQPIEKQVVAEDLFNDNELQFDVFASYSYGENEKITKTTKHDITFRNTKDVFSDRPRIIPEAFPRQGPKFIVTVTHITRTGTQHTTETKTVGHTGLFDSDNAFGGGVGLNYFFARYFGFGAEGDWFAGGEAIHIVDGNLFLRYPINFDFTGKRRGIAPYLFGGYGARFDGTKWGVGHVGAGVELRLNHRLAWFVDGRFVFGHGDAEAGIWRSGVRVIF